MVNLIDEQSRLNVTGADASDDAPDDNGAVEHVFLDASDSGDPTADGDAQRARLLQYVQRTLDPSRGSDSDAGTSRSNRANTGVSPIEIEPNELTPEPIELIELTPEPIVLISEPPEPINFEHRLMT
jgi:hypothetical protein